MMELGMKITQMYLNPFDRIIGIIGAKDSGKSWLIKGMFPGIQTVESDDEFDILNMPLLNSEEVGFYTPKTFHVDVRAARKYVSLEEISKAVLHVISQHKRVEAQCGSSHRDRRGGHCYQTFSFRAFAG